METNNLIKQIKDKVRETIAQEKLDWNRTLAEYKEQQELLAKSQQERIIGFKW